MNGNMMLGNATELDKAVEEVSAVFADLTFRVRFEPFQAVTCKYARMGDWVEMSISDYLEDAPAEELAGLIRSCLDKICKKTDIMEYDTMRLAKYAMAYRDAYLDRNFLEVNEHLTSEVRSYLEHNDVAWCDEVIVATGHRASTSKIMKVIAVEDEGDIGALFAAVDRLIGAIGEE